MDYSVGKVPGLPLPPASSAFLIDHHQGQLCDPQSKTGQAPVIGKCYGLWLFDDHTLPGRTYTCLSFLVPGGGLREERENKDHLFYL